MNDVWKENVMNSLFRIFSAVVLAVSIGACSSTGSKPGDGEGAEVVDQSTTDGASGTDGASTSGLGGGSSFSGSELDDPASPLSTRVIYFDFDQNTIRSEFMDTLAAHADYLAGHPGVTVILEGHADERGTREYNIALGERRANSVRQTLMLQGGSSTQLESVSYGEEKPAVPGHDESAWQMNRRVELVYPGP